MAHVNEMCSLPILISSSCRPPRSCRWVQSGERGRRELTLAHELVAGAVGAAAYVRRQPHSSCGVGCRRTDSACTAARLHRTLKAHAPPRRATLRARSTPRTGSGHWLSSSCVTSLSLMIRFSSSMMAGVIVTSFRIISLRSDL